MGPEMILLPHSGCSHHDAAQVRFARAKKKIHVRIAGAMAADRKSAQDSNATHTMVSASGL
jgi:hypothetical protein